MTVDRKVNSLVEQGLFIWALGIFVIQSEGERNG